MVRDGDGLYHLTDGAGAKVGANANGGSRADNLGSPTTVEEERPRRNRETPPVPGDYDRFKEFGLAVGVWDKGLLEAICNYVFSGNPHDLNWVWEALASTHLRNDYLHRWFRLWQGHLNLPIPTAVARRMEQTPHYAWANPLALLYGIA